MSLTWPVKFGLKCQLIVLSEFPCMYLVTFLLLLFRVLLLFCHVNYNVSWCGPLWGHLIWKSVLPGPVCLFPSPGCESFQLSFHQISFLTLLIHFFWRALEWNVSMLDVVSEVP